MSLLDGVLLAVAGAAIVSSGLFALRWRAGQRRLADLERLAKADDVATRELAAAAERNRIAREMHDVVAHTLSVVVAQADGGRFVARSDASAAARALDTIAEVGRSALAEMRALLGVLRSSDGEVALGPQPSLGDIPALIAQVRDAQSHDGGLEISFVTTGTPRTLPIGAGLAIYRIVQEALTNVLKHAGPNVKAFAQLAWDADNVTVTISDDGRGAAARGEGQGLGIAGMRERATIFGGSLVAGPQAGGGFVVRARLPFPQGDQT